MHTQVEAVEVEQCAALRNWCKFGDIVEVATRTAALSLTEAFSHLAMVVPAGAGNLACNGLRGQGVVGECTQRAQALGRAGRTVGKGLHPST